VHGVGGGSIVGFGFVSSLLGLTPWSAACAFAEALIPNVTTAATNKVFIFFSL